ncbi:tetratricopeptide repeat protein [Salidesulfovibrio onnuriiensis]|uniref:tetratricopeptide repeat protein n=1 Tax=Salidesulfovibrio onnuriiensis TaxID=2583823 RepID=UPI00202B9C2D|nr:tetratricopeptide repeat protein [Salidesulfovibrio onnuriiensis]
MTEPEVGAEDLIEGVFSIEKTVKIGTGTTARRVKQQAYYYAKQISADTIQIQGLGADNVPAGFKVEISKEELLNDYLPDPSRYNQVMKKLREIQKAVARGDKFRKRGETFTAEYEYNKALSLDEQNVRANFGVGICYMARGETEKAQEVFERVLEIEAAFGDEHKHLFNEYGIQLRKNKMYNEAVEYYNRALELTQDDENLYYNLARAQLERQDYDSTRKALAQCLKLRPDHQEGLKVLAFLKKKGLLKPKG